MNSTATIGLVILTAILIYLSDQPIKNIIIKPDKIKIQYQLNKSSDSKGVDLTKLNSAK